VQPFADDAIRRRHRRERGAHRAFAVLGGLQLFRACFHRCLFLGSESLFLGGALAGLLLALVCDGAHRAPFARSA